MKERDTLIANDTNPMPKAFPRAITAVNAARKEEPDAIPTWMNNFAIHEITSMKWAVVSARTSVSGGKGIWSQAHCSMQAAEKTPT